MAELLQKREFISNTHTNKGGRYGSGGRAVVWQSEGCRYDPHPGCVEVSLSKTPNPQLLLSGLVPCMAANHCECECECERVNERHKLYSALDKGAI